MAPLKGKGPHFTIKWKSTIKSRLYLPWLLIQPCLVWQRFSSFSGIDNFSLGRTFLLPCLCYSLPLSNLFLFDSYSSILSLELGRMRNGGLYPMDPLVQPIRFHSKCWESAAWQDTFLFRHRFRHADFYDILRAFNLVDTTQPDPFLRMRVGHRGHYSYFPCDVCFMIFLRQMVYPSSYRDLVNEYNIPLMQICEIFHATLSWVYSKYAHRLLQPVRYCGN